MTSDPSGDIAIIGMAGRFPGANDLAEFWLNLRDGVESISIYDEAHLAAAGVAEEDFTRPDYVRAGAPLAGIDLFDADFFGYTAREAEVMDPQQRLFLETAWEALEQGGYDPARHDGPIGVFGGAGSNGYLRNVYSNLDVVAAIGGTQVLVGNELGFLSTRVSYKLDLRGPSVSLRTTCSTSLVAVHMACQSLRVRECDMALSGGVFVNLEQDKGYQYQEGSFLSRDGHCRPFDAAAHGTLFGSGVGVVMLKRLSDATRDADTIHAVIKGSAVNNDGAMKVGFTAPAVDGQAEVITQALAAAGVDAASIGYIEAHGTGTILGDPIEVQALTNAYRSAGVRDGHCALGSAKGAIGHLDAAAGMASLVKTVLALRAETLPPSVNFSAPNPAVDFARTPFRVQRTAEPWLRTGQPRRAGISAFGFGGTNAHMIVEEAPPGEQTGADSRGSQLLVLAARTPEDLEAMTDRLTARLRLAQPSLADTAFTLAVGRHEFAHRRVVTGPDALTVAAALEARDPTRVVTRQLSSDSPPVAFLFSGQGSQYPGMAGELYEHEPVFRDAMAMCAEIAQEVLVVDFRDFVLPADPVGAGDRLRQTEIAQSAVFAVEYALTQLWQSWGIVPSSVLGHSLGEYVAACVSGVFAIEDAVRLVALRGQLMQQQPGGSMLSVSADRSTVESLLPEELSLAAHNGPKDCVVSGADDAITEFAALAKAHGVVTRPVATSHAFHSALMRPMTEQFVAAVHAIPRKPPQIPIVSNVTGQWLTDEEAQDPAYWARHALAPVEFAAGLANLAAPADTVLLEVGPSQTLSSVARRALAGTAARTITSTLPHPNDARGALETAQRALGQLWLSGVRPDWRGYYRGERRHRIDLPTYPFRRKRYWLEPNTEAAVAAVTVPKPRRARSSDIADWFSMPSWERTNLADVETSFVGQHWLLFADRCGLAEALAERLRQAGGIVSVVATEPAVTGTYLVDPRQGSDYDRLFAELRSGPGLPDHLAHCWNVTPDGASIDLETTLCHGFYSLVEISQALNRHDDGVHRTMWVISNGLHEVVGGERLDPLKATLLGPCRVIPREQPGFGCRSVDVVLAGGPTDWQIDQLMGEFGSGTAPETVAYRGKHRWSQQYVRHPLRDSDRPTHVRPGGVYLVTGGLGGLGLALAEHLAKLGTKLVLVSRTALPPEAEWGQRMAGDDKVAAIVRQLVRIRAAGAEVMVAEADVADADQISAAVEQTVRRWGTIDGVFHAAGLPGGGLAQLKTRAAAAEVLRPKVHGTLALEQALAGHDPDFMVLFGSNAANIGDFGLVDYCAANSFLDAYAHSRARHRRVVTVDWGPWQEVGMAVTADVPSGLESVRREDVAMRGMAPADALAALDRVLRQRTLVPQVVVSPTDLSVLFANVFTLGQQAEKLAGLMPSATSTHPRPGIETGYVPPRNDTQRRMCEAWQTILGLDRVGVNDSFFDLGGNSLVAIQLMSTISDQAGTRLSVADLFEALTISRLSDVIDGGVQADAELLAENKKRAEQRRAERGRTELGRRRQQQRRTQPSH